MDLENKLIATEEKEPEIEDENVKKALEKYGYLGKEDPFSSANCISHLFLYWAYKVVRLANLVTLKTEYLGTLKGKFSSQHFLERMKEVWEQKGFKFKKTVPLIQAAFYANLCNFIIVVLMNIVKVLISMLSIDILREYMKRFGMTEEEVKKNICLYSPLSLTQIGLICLFIKLFEIFYAKYCSEVEMNMIVNVCAQLQGIIFDKILKVSPSSFKERAEIGQLTNFLEYDSHKLSHLMLDCPNFFTIPVQIIGYFFLLFKYLGISFLSGFATLLLFFFINICIIRKLKSLIKQNIALKDIRMKTLIETIDYIKIIKLYSWEEEFKDKIYGARENELNMYDVTFKIKNINNTIGFLTPIAISIVSIGTYQSSHPYLKIADIMSALNIFNTIQEPLEQIPKIINDFNEVGISMYRIQDYLFQDEINVANIIVNDKNMETNNLSLKIENGNFSWGVPPKSLEDSESSTSLLPVVEDKHHHHHEKHVEENLFSKENSTKTDTNFSDNDNINQKITNSQSDNVEGGLGLEISGESDKSLDPLKPILNNINIEIKKGEFVCIIGEVGCGKSSLLHVFLNSLLPVTANSKIYVNGSISYVSQVPWIRNTTIRENILFHLPYDDQKYNEIIDLSELNQDLGIFQAGDLTEIGERGLNLSGGQKARIAIARALYADKDIYIFDDPISSLDVNVGMKVMKNCIIDYLSNKTRILATHALQYISFADKIVYMNKGEIIWVGTYNEIKQQDFFKSFYEKNQKQALIQEQQLKEEVPEETSSDDDEEEEEIETEAFDDDHDHGHGHHHHHHHHDHKHKRKHKHKHHHHGHHHNKGIVKRLTKEEKHEKGRVKCSVYKDFIKKIGVCTIVGAFIITLIMSVSLYGKDIWLAYWTKQQSESHNLKYFFIYCSFGITGCFFTYFKERLQSINNIKLSRTIHQEMIESLLRASVPTFHETIPRGQILNRFSNDMEAIDRGGISSFVVILNSAVLLLSSIGICGYFEPYSLLTIPPILLIGYKISSYYRSASRELKRMENSKRSPVISLCHEVIPGSTTIRAFGFQSKYVILFHERINEHVKLELIESGCIRWFEMSLDILSFFFIAFLIIFTIIFKNKFTAQAVSLIFTYCTKMKDMLTSFLTNLTNYERGMIEYERCLEYTKIPSEAPLKKDQDDNLVNWPENGKIEFINYSVKYRPDTEIVLNNINCLIKGNEKVGIAGRTGSGKSTITLCLFRILEATEGKIKIDDVDISTIGLEKLRSSLTIIPQDPVLMEGTLRYNIDPLNKSNATDILQVMKKIGFDYIVKRNNLGLNQEITERGSNLSVGEKQLICITRAILRNSKIIVMDEATASIDYKTEELIQKAINEILNNSTFITIAHRIKTILNYDRIMVLDNGRIVDFDTPDNLLNNKESLFYELYSKSVI